MKLGFMNERPEYARAPQWSETGDRYVLKLFRDFVFHQCLADGAPVLDAGHVVSALNKLDQGDQEQMMLSSRDNKDLLVVSFSDVRRCLESTFIDLESQAETAQQLAAAAAGGGGDGGGSGGGSGGYYGGSSSASGGAGYRGSGGGGGSEGGPMSMGRGMGMGMGRGGGPGAGPGMGYGMGGGRLGPSMGSGGPGGGAGPGFSRMPSQGHLSQGGW